MGEYIIFEKGTGNHKYKANVYDADTEKKIKTVNFGAKKKPGGGYYRQYEDKTGLNLYTHLNYKGNIPDKEAKEKRDNYRKRHMKIMRNNKGKKIPAYKVKYSPAYMSLYFLW